MSDNESEQRRNNRSRPHGNRRVSREAEILRLAYELRAGGIAERGLGFALTTLGAETVAEALADSEPFGRGARLRAARSEDRDRRAAWTILAACSPGAVHRRLQVAGVASKAFRSTTDRGRGRRAAGRPDLRIVGGTETFGEGASTTPLQEQLVPVAEALFGEARAA